MAERRSGAERRRKGRASRQLNLSINSPDETLHIQLTREIKRLVAEGALRAGAKLPSSRELSQTLGVSRNTVVAAIQQLAADGLLVLKRGSGAYVAVDVPAKGRRTAHTLPMSTERPPFAIGVPAVDIFPFGRWNKMQSKRWRRMPRNALDEEHSVGWSGLRRVIASYLTLSRGLRCEPEQVIVTSGIRAGVGLAASVLARRGDQALVEDPGYFAVKETLRAMGLLPIPVRVDNNGLDISASVATPDARIAVLTPHCQFPTGAVMSSERVAAVAAWSRCAESWIIEDGHDSDVTAHLRAPLLAQGVERSVFVNSFNTTLFPSLRVGYVVVPSSLVDAFVAAQRDGGSYANVPTQIILSDFLESGAFDDHMRNSREAYAERGNVLQMALHGSLSHVLTGTPKCAGLHFIAMCPPNVSLRTFVEDAAAADIDLTPMTRFLEQALPAERRFLLGFSGFPPAALRQSATRLAHFCDKF